MPRNHLDRQFAAAQLDDDRSAHGFAVDLAMVLELAFLVERHGARTS